MILTDQQKQIRDMVRELAQKEFGPMAGHYDQTGEFPTKNIELLLEKKLMGIVIPEEYGGAGLDYVSYQLVLEEISKECAATGVILAVHMSVGTYPIYQFGTEEQKKKYLPQLTSGKLAAFGLTEPNAGSDAKAIKTKATKDGDHYLLEGTKTFISNGEGDIIIVVAKTQEDEYTAFIVEKGFEGFSVGEHENKMGIRGSQVVELIFDNCRVPEENILGGLGNGIKVALGSLDGGRIGIASQALGIAQGALDEAIKYSKERHQFGKPISAFQGIQWKIADMSTKCEAARQLIHHAAALKDAGQSFSKEAAQAKLFASTNAVDVVREAVQIHGGHGYMIGSKVERAYRDIKITEIYEGTNEIQRMVIARALLR